MIYLLWIIIIALIVVLLFLLVIVPISQFTARVTSVTRDLDGKETVKVSRNILFWKSTFTYHIADDIVYCDYDKNGVEKAHRDLADDIKEKAQTYKTFGR